MPDLDAVFRALRAPARRDILALIWDRELAAGQIAAAFELTHATISEHLAVLREAGLVDVRRLGTSRRYRARRDAVAGLHDILSAGSKWTPADAAPERQLAATSTARVVIARVDVATDVETTFTAFTDGRVYSRWLQAPVTIRDGLFSATMEWGTEVRGRYDVVSAPHLIAMSWDFDDDNVPVPGAPLVGYLRIDPAERGGSTVVVHQLVDTDEQAAFMQGAWSLVLGRLKTGVVAASSAQTPPALKPKRAKRSRPVHHPG